MVRRIVACASCRKRFLTSRGSTLCLSCRPKEGAAVPPGLTYGGESLSVPGNSDDVAVAGGEAGDDGERSLPADAEAGTKGIADLSAAGARPDGPACTRGGIAGDDGRSSPRSKDAVVVPEGGFESSQGVRTTINNDRKRKQSTAISGGLESPTAASLAADPTPKRQRIDGGGGSSSLICAPEARNTNVNIALGNAGDIHHKEGNAHETLCTIAADPTGSMDRKPKVSLGSTCYDGSSDDSDGEGDEMDALIAQDSMWGEKCDRKSTDEVQDIEFEAGQLLGDATDGGDDSDVECLGTSCVAETTKGGTLNSAAEEFEEFDKSPAACKGSGLDCCNDADQNGIDAGHQSEQRNYPQRDVCYICGSDLSRLSTGLKGRVAHMKRCSAKYGRVMGGRNAMRGDGNFDSDFMASGADDVQSPQSNRKNDGGVFNPYDKSRWHGDAGDELETNKANNPPPKQSTLGQFFNKPVRSLTNVLMAGARQVAKGKAIATLKGATSGKQPYKRGQWRSSNNGKRNGSCPPFKRIPGTDFICDGFHYATPSLSGNYFLTHFHSDHYGGIGKAWNDGIIYCSLPTANLVHQQLGVDKKYLHPLPMNAPTVIASRGKPVRVTALDANHCPGAIMFLFEVGNKRILHVGDFRWNRDLMMQHPQLRAFRDGTHRLDDLFLDTTYCNAKYCLPTQEEAINAAIAVAVIEMAKSKKDLKEKTLFLFGSYTIGKEKIYLSVAEKLKMKLYVDSRRYRILSSLEWPKERMQLFTKDKSETSLWVVPLGSINFKQMGDYLNEGNKSKAFSAPYGRAVGFRPTGWTYQPKSQDKKQRTLPGCSKPKPQSNLISSKTSGRFSVHGVPYSEHSSFPELVDCLRVLKPRKITPTVSVSKSEEQVALLLNALNGKLGTTM